MPKRLTNRRRPRGAALPTTAAERGRAISERAIDGRVPEAIRTTLQGAEALSTGLVHAVTGTMVTAVRGVQEVGAEIGSTAVSAVRGSIRAAEEIGGDLGRLAVNATTGAVGAGRDVGVGVGRVAVEAAHGAVGAAQRARASAARMLGLAERRPLRRMDGARPRRQRRAA
jgi:hypothetical protein